MNASTQNAPFVEIIEVGPRDGIQNESVPFSTQDKLELIERAEQAGFSRIEVTSFVHPKRVPQMADAEAVVAALRGKALYVGLALNVKGAERAAATQINEIGCVAAATDAFGLKNQGQDSAQSIAECRRIMRFAAQQGLRYNVTISAAWGCPYEGEVDPGHIVAMAKHLADEAPHEIALGDTIGVGDPWRVQALFAALRDALPGMPLRGHFHNTRNTGLANAFAAIRAGVRRLDSSLGGMGGCPFAPGATGNIPSEDLVYMLTRGGVQTGLDQLSLVQTARWLSGKLGRRVEGLLSRAGPFPAMPSSESAA